MRKRIFEIIEIAQDGDKASRVYDTVMMITIILSLIPLAFKTETLFFSIVDKVTVTIFILDYILRWITADYKLNKKDGPSCSTLFRLWQLSTLFRFFRLS